MRIIFKPKPIHKEQDITVTSRSLERNDIEIYIETHGMCTMWLIEGRSSDWLVVVRGTLNRCEALFDAIHKAYKDGEKVFDVREWEAENPKPVLETCPKKHEE